MFFRQVAEYRIFRCSSEVRMWTILSKLTSLRPRHERANTLSSDLFIQRLRQGTWFGGSVGSNRLQHHFLTVWGPARRNVVTRMVLLGPGQGAQLPSQFFLSTASIIRTMSPPSINVPDILDLILEHLRVYPADDIARLSAGVEAS